MEIRDQIEKDLEKLSTAILPDNVRKEIDRATFKLKTKNSAFEVTEIDDPFVKAFSEISQDKRLTNEATQMLSVIRVLTEFGALDGQACEKIFSLIDSQISSASDAFNLKVLQVALSSFSSPALSLDPRITTTKWIFKLISSNSLMVKQVAMATSYQLLDVVFDQAYKRNKKSYDVFSAQNKNDSDNDKNKYLNESVEAAAENLVSTLSNGDTTSDCDAHTISQDSIPHSLLKQRENQQIGVDSSHWSITLIYILLLDLISSLMGEMPLVFNNVLNKQNNDFYRELIKYILDRNMSFLSGYQQKFKDLMTKLITYTNMQSDPALFTLFLPHIILSLCETNVSQMKQFIDKLCLMMDTTPTILNTFALMIIQNPGLQFTLINAEQLKRLAKKACSYFITNFRGTLSKPVLIFGQNKLDLPNYNSLDKSNDTILSSCISILYLQIPQCIRHLEHFDSIFDSFETIWQRIIITTDNSQTLSTSLKVGRLAVKISIVEGYTDPANRILSTLCGLALPQSTAFPLQFKGVIALHSVIKLLKQLTYRLSNFWPLIFETLSKCHHTASHKRSPADSQALILISPNLLDFSPTLSQEQFKKLFNIILNLAKNEMTNFIQNKGTVPNFWPLKIILSIFISNLNRTSLIEAQFFEHMKALLHCESSEFRSQATEIVFDVSKEVINNENTTKECRQYVFDFIFLTANSTYKDVSVTAFSSILPFLAGGTAEKIDEGWPMILTVLKAVWTSQFTENIQNGFRTLNFICRDCLRLLGISWIEVLLSTISSYISQTDDINTSLGSVNLFWDLGSGMVPISSDEHITVWKALFKTLQTNFKDNRQNVRIATLETFFNLVSTFNQQFPEELQNYVINDVFFPLFDSIRIELEMKKQKNLPLANNSSNASTNSLTTSNPNVMVKSNSSNSFQQNSNKSKSSYGKPKSASKETLKEVDNSDVYLLAIQNGIQCLHSLGHYEKVMPIIVQIIEEIALTTSNSRAATESLKCLTQFIAFDDSKLLGDVTKSMSKIVEYYTTNHCDQVMQGAATVASDIFIKIAPIIKDDEFSTWITIMNSFCTFQNDKQFLNVATHIALNCFSSIHDLSEERLCIIVKMIVSLIEESHQTLSTKCFETIYQMYDNLFTTENRGSCISLILPIFQRSMKTVENCSTYFNKLINLPANLYKILENDQNVKKFVEIGRRYDEFRKPIVEMMSNHMNNISEKSFPVFLSLAYDSPELYITFFEKFCSQTVEDENFITFSKKVKSLFAEQIKIQIELILSEEKALSSVLPNQRYSCLISFLSKMIHLKTNDKIFEISGCSSIGHLYLIIDSVVLLSECRNNELKHLSKQIVSIVNENTMHTLKSSI